MSFTDSRPSSRYGHVTFISAGAGSGKTYRLTTELEQALVDGQVEPAGIIGTTFTVKAAAELRERVRERLIEKGEIELAERTAESLIGTVHSVCERLLQRFAFELDLSPQLSVLSLEDGQGVLETALDDVLDDERKREMNALSYRLGLTDSETGLPIWQNVVKDVADKARENDIEPASLEEMGSRSVEAMLAYFPAPANGDAGKETLLKVLRSIIEEMPDLGEVLVEKYRDMLTIAERQMRRPNCAWANWMRLAGTSTNKSVEQHWRAVQEAASVYQSHPDFHADLRGLVCGVFEIAARTLGRFQAIKQERGLIDFPDMEQMMLHALDEPQVRKRIGDELQLLLVDEFQDTNPMQLALFLKLARLADRAVFVGDPKQAIYAFRGCDPDLVFETLKGLARGGSASDLLSANYRSTPALVRCVNGVFGAAFAKDGRPREEVELEAKRDDHDGPALLWWTETEDNMEKAATALAAKLGRLVADKTLVVDPETGKARPVRFGDIAVLARTHSHEQHVANALRAAKVPMKMTLEGLLSTPEVVLARSCLRRLADPGDSLAIAEIMSLADCAEPEQWILDRLDWLAEEHDSGTWGQDHPIVARLAEMRDDSRLRSPVEVVARVLNEVDMRRIVTAWGPDDVRATQRQKNLDALLDLSVMYEEHAGSQRDPGTLAGFLQWLQHPTSPELDLQPVITSGDAVHVLTYHRAKGLEWPVVVCVSFNYEENRSAVWDVRAETRGEFDVEAPLANRELLYWPDIYGTRKNGVPQKQAIEASADGIRCRERSEAEQRRLAYVGMTRARDMLVILAPPCFKQNAWFQSFGHALPPPVGDELRLPDVEEPIPAVRETIEAERIEIDRSYDYHPRWFEKRERVSYPPKVVQPSSAAPAPGARVVAQTRIGERIVLRGKQMADVGNGLHAVIAAEFVNRLAEGEAASRAAALLKAQGVDKDIGASDAVHVAARLRRHLEGELGALRFEMEVPVSHCLADGRVVRGAVDLLAETPDGWLVIDHKSSPQRVSTWESQAIGYSGQLAMYRDALRGAGRTVAGCFIHFAVTGGLVRVDFD